MRYLGIDFGERRIGLAISDTAASVATPLTTILRHNDSQAISEIAAVIDREEIGGIVVGEPRRLDGSRGPAADRVGSFSRKLAAATGLDVELVDEALTTHEAATRQREIGGPSPRDLDSLAAQIILQEALDRRASHRQASRPGDTGSRGA